MREPGDLWKLRGSVLDRARKSARRGDLEGLHDFRVALRRLSATARALGKQGLSRQARRIARSLSAQRQLQVDRQLLARVGQLGFLSPDAVTALAARWEKLAVRGERRIVKTAEGRSVRRLVKRLARLSKRGQEDALERLERARRRAEAALADPIEGKDDRSLHRLRIAVKKARY